MMRGEGNGLIRLAEAITDEIAVDWDAERREHPELARRLPALRLIERIAAVYRDQPSPESDAGGEGWGPLRIGEKLGEGGYGAVYRARDPRLGRDVALKLLRDDLPPDGPHARRILAEARLMARVRHPNVLTIHGADVHDGRAGFWADLLDGETLERRLERDGVLGADEAALCGRELCRALGAVHAAGLVHGDVKAANVMRTRDGRLVLMDFGAGAPTTEGRSAAAPLSGTPLALAPEVLEGEGLSVATDVYALGVLLYRLTTGRYPVEADSVSDLRSRHAAGGRPPLLDRRPDLPSDFARIVERALDPDPRRRFASAGEMEAALAATLREGSPTVSGNPTLRRFRAWLGVVAVVVVAGLLLLPWLRRSDDAHSAAASLSATAAFARADGGFDEVLADGSLVRPGDRLVLDLRLDRPAHVYVLNEDRGGSVFVLFPLEASDLRNPLPADVSLRLPGSRGGTALSWRVTEGAGEERFLVVASSRPLGWLETRLKDYVAAARDREPTSTTSTSGSGVPERGVGGLAEEPGSPAPTSELAALTARLSEDAGRGTSLWFHTALLYNTGR